MAGPELSRVKQVIYAFRQDQARQLLGQTLRLGDASEIRRLVTEAPRPRRDRWSRQSGTIVPPQQIIKARAVP
jgi:hypothetical protein